MNFDYSEDELLIKDQARRFLADQDLLPLVRAMLDGKERERASALWSAVSAQGWPGAAIPEAYGGYGLGHVALCAIAEEAGRACAPLPLFSSIYLASEAILLTGSEAQKHAWLPRLASGELLGTGYLDAREENHLEVLASGTLLNGRLSPLPHADIAHLAVITAREEEGGVSLFLVDLAEEGVSRTPVSVIDDSMPHAALTFDNVKSERLGAPRQGSALSRHIQARAATLLAFEQLGGADACLEMALAYARERRTFGRVIGSYQAMKHKLADIYIKNELARSNAYFAAWALADDAPELELAAATARVSATEAYEFAAAENIQTHGGMGFTWEADPHLHYRRSRLLAHAVGSSGVWQQRLVGALDAQLAA